jgi:hypothetical protein
VADALFSEPRLAELYDPLDPDRSDLDAYVALAAEFNAGTWTDLTAVEGNLVSFRTTFRLGRDRTVLTSDSTLRFRSRDELTRSLLAAGLVADEVRDASDRPGREFVFIASRPS